MTQTAGRTLIRGTAMVLGPQREWAVATPAIPGGQYALNAVAGVAPDMAWAVGQTSEQPLIERWTGTRWEIVPSPQQATTVGAGLLGVAACGPAAIAVGGAYDRYASVEVPLIQHWTGQTWTSYDAGTGFVLTAITIPDTATTPRPHSAEPNDADPHGPGPGSAGPGSAGPGSAGPGSAGPGGAGPGSAGPGSAGPGSAGAGTAGRHSAGPNGGSPHDAGAGGAGPHGAGRNGAGAGSAGAGGRGAGVAGAGVTAWAVGHGFARAGAVAGPVALRWDGEDWTRVPVPGPPRGRLLAVSGSGPDELWAVGGSPDGPVVVRSDGTDWRPVGTPRAKGPLTAVVALGPRDVWAAGGSTVHHWNGRRWHRDDPGIASVNTLTALSPTDIWAAGGDGELAHFDGRRWRRISAPPPLAGSAVWLGSAAITPDTVWMVGSMQSPQPQPPQPGSASVEQTGPRALPLT